MPCDEEGQDWTGQGTPQSASKSPEAKEWGTEKIFSCLDLRGNQAVYISVWNSSSSPLRRHTSVIKAASVWWFVTAALRNEHIYLDTASSSQGPGLLLGQSERVELYQNLGERGQVHTGVWGTLGRRSRVPQGCWSPCFCYRASPTLTPAYWNWTSYCFVLRPLFSTGDQIPD